MISSTPRSLKKGEEGERERESEEIQIPEPTISEIAWNKD